MTGHGHGAGHGHDHGDPSAMRSVEEHAAVVAALLPPQPAQRCAVGEALGRVLAEDLVSPGALPPFSNSAMDGYAVRAGDTSGAADGPVTLPVVADVPAGRTDGPPLEPGTAHRIMTGAPLPEGADAVVQVEWTDGGTPEGGAVRIDRGVAAGQNVRRAGEDVDPGTVVLDAGTVLGPAQIGLAAAVGAGEVSVRRRPRVLVLSTGSELVAPGEPLRHGQIHESNGPMLAAAVVDAGGEAELLRFVPDDVDTFLATLDTALADGTVDLVLTSGGVSAGAYEVVKDAFSGRGVEFAKVAMQPGMPQGAGRHRGPAGDVAVVTLPGNPVSSLVSFEVFVRPALRAASGHPQPGRARVRARLTEDLASPSGRRQFRRGRIDAVTGTVAPVGAPGSHLLAALARADCLLVVAEDTTRVEAGAEVEVWLLEG